MPRIYPLYEPVKRDYELDEKDKKVEPSARKGRLITRRPVEPA
jgi:hypothetical protein